MENKEMNAGTDLIRKSTLLDNPVLRHFIKKHRLNDKDALVLGGLLELTDQMKTPIKTTYRAIAEGVELTTMSVYQSIESLHRNRIIEYKPTGDYVHISFSEIDDSIEEINLAYINARKIKRIEADILYMKKQQYVPSAELFDMIYPIIGKLVAKKIADALRSLVNYIDERLDAVLSMKMWRYRIMAFRTKVPLGEIILRESLPFYIDEIFLLDKKSSLLLGHASRNGEEKVDRDLVGGMLAAINDFIKTSFKAEKSSIDEIQFGNSKVMVTEHVYFFGAIVAKGSPPLEFDARIEGVMNDIHILYRRQLKNFSGNMEDVAGIEKPLARLIEDTNRVPGTGAGGDRPLGKVKWAAALLSCILAVFLARGIYCRVVDRQFEKKIADHMERSLPAYSHDLVFDVDGNELAVTGTVSSAETAEALMREVKKIPGIREVDNRAVIADYRSVRRFRSELEGLTGQMAGLQLALVKQELEKIVIQFPTGVMAVDNAQLLQVRRAWEILKQHPRIHIDVIAFNDPAGGVEVNRRLAEGRMAAVKQSFIRLGMPGERIHVTDFDPEILSADPRFAEFRENRGIMMFAKIPH
jgi:outer membrane protein OmpA-like peptidoglycan-associated protein